MYERLRTYLIVAAQAGLAAELSWFITRDVLHSAEPLFAPAVAIGTIAGAIGNRIRRTLEVIAGLTVGAMVAHLVTRAIGGGPAQTGVVVALAISAAVAIRGTGAVTAQAGGTALLLGSVAPGPDLAVSKTESAVVGGVVAIAVAYLILPLNPMRVAHRIVRPTVDAFARELTATADALTHRDLQQAKDALQRFSATREQRQKATELVAAAQQVVVLSPWRRRRLGMMRRYQHAAEHLEDAYSSACEMVKWATATIRAGEPVPAGLPASIEHVGQALRLLYREVLPGREPDPMRTRALQAIKDVNEACAEGVEFSGGVVATRVRATVSELLQASGLPQAEANKQAGLKADV
ncbi:FUSC family protein [Micromonospora globispora]|uniref:FUSC family protein n=1 Tax=Micromonospora globispora TaxID=1450148 RepID=A0A317JZB8_9ACTN|nr:FUSC family protein [Micromonospora globispora]PWU58479.1 FUSC family protein [Micromonospora globispora]RQW84869.1 FUSC family protein [Micromonospora globispora]